jgi:UDP-N-acetylglucosamine 2-epimerase (non-hydrolysing)
MSVLNESSNLKIAGPYLYKPFCHLLNHASLVITDSGGIQEELSFLGTPLVIVRDQTERSEALGSLVTKLTKATQGEIIKAVSPLLIEIEAYNGFYRFPASTFGDGEAATRVISALKHFADKEALPVDYKST